MTTLMVLMSTAMADTVALSMPVTADNGGHGWISAEAAITQFADSADGGYMFNTGGTVTPDSTFSEGILTTTDGVTSLTLAPRTGAGGSGEAIVLSATNLDTVDSFTFSISNSSCTSTADIALTLAVIQKSEDNTWSILESTTGTLTLNSGADLTLTLSESIDWSDSYKVVAVIDNAAKKLGGGNSPTYTLTGITMTAEGTVVVPEPATATLSLLALAGLAARRRRK